MKTIKYGISLLALVTALTSFGQSDTNDANRLTFSARLGFNISAKFKGLSTLPPPTPRTTPNGDNYNYDDGYVLTDISGNFGGLTWYWGYDDNSQISGDTILMNRSTPSGAPSSNSLEDSPQYGAELVYDRQLIMWGKARLGVEIAANYLN